MPGFQFQPQHISDFENNGYVIIENFLDPEEVNKLSGIALGDMVMQKNAIDLTDQAGKRTKLTSWFTPGDALFFHSNLLHRSEAKEADFVGKDMIHKEVSEK